jgi:hypothetical protein
VYVVLEEDGVSASDLVGRFFFCFSGFEGSAEHGFGLELSEVDVEFVDGGFVLVVFVAYVAGGLLGFLFHLEVSFIFVLFGG